ncbi:hypothetical protein QMU90_003512 [Edwardsiella ictaluri]|uniref:Fimbrial-type adhesion domain-containing protein n=2 Tax=Edwardsiella ictaluri TaxID=67780 RepID=A0ABY8GEM6_EDWIC|nr:hypothetical protein [Edwardsiella ictaluri]ELV7529545.1 hypothetical protein [Edwardsiella ictaluri]WFN95952.1 hypothetical protein MAY91_14080 [Edwardsiella ictaluri]
MYCVIGERLLRYLMYGIVALSLMAKSHAIVVDLVVFNQDVRIAYGAAGRLQVLGNGIVQAQDNYPELVGFNVYDFGSRTNQSNTPDIAFYRRGSLFSVTLTGARYGRSITLRGKLGKSIFLQPSVIGGSFNNRISENKGCSGGIQYDRPLRDDEPINGIWNFIDPGTYDFTQDCSGNTYPFVYVNPYPVVTYDDARTVWLDLPALIASDAWQSLPPDVYSGSSSSAFEYVYSPQTGQTFNLNTATAVTIRKQPYFSGLSIPSTHVVFNTTYTQEQVTGRASTPLLLEGSFDQVRIGIYTGNNYALRNDADGRDLPYQAVLHQGAERHVLNTDDSFVVSGLNNPSNQIPLTLTFQFDQPRERVTSGTYRDYLLFLAEVPLL